MRFRVAAGALALLLAWAAWLQHNDPDPLPWMALYGAVAALSAAAAAGRRLPRLAATAFAVCAALALAWLPELQGARPQAFTSLPMRAVADEAPREALGLLLCAAWTGLLWARWRA